MKAGEIMISDPQIIPGEESEEEKSILLNNTSKALAPESNRTLKNF